MKGSGCNTAVEDTSLDCKPGRGFESRHFYGFGNVFSIGP